MLEDIYSKTSAAEVQWSKSASQVEGGTKRFPLVFVLFVLLAALLLIRFSDSIGRGARNLPNPEVTFSIAKQTGVCDSPGCNQVYSQAVHQARSERRAANAAQFRTRAIVAAPVISGNEALFIGTGDFGQGVWIRP